MKIIITNRIYLHDCSKQIIRQKLLDHLTISNPKYTEAVSAGRKSFHIPKTISMFQQHTASCFSIPRGAEQFLNKLLDKYDPKAEFDDRTCFLEEGIEYDCKITPWKQQIPAIEAGLSTEVNVLSLPTGFGKTVIAIVMIHKRKQSAFILVHTKELLYQWQERLKQFLNFDCGLVGDGKFIIKDITVGLIRTVVNRSKSDNFTKKFGYLIVDECHRVSSSMFTEACVLFEPYYLTGLSATPKRRDGLSKFIFFTLGDLVYNMDKSEGVRHGKILKPTIIKRNTGLYFGDSDEQCTYVELISKLKKSEKRNQMIANDIMNLSQVNFSCCLCLSDHDTHIKLIQEQLGFFNLKYHTLTGKLSTKKRKQVVSDLKQGKVNILLATTSLLSDGFDYNAFTSLNLMMPVSYDGRLEQILGRVIRTKTGKNKVLIYDYVDKNAVFQNQWNKRKKVYESY